MKKIISKSWEPEKYEKKLYSTWESKGYFKPEINPEGEPYSIIMPPPNANGSLHLGHAVFVTLEDIMTRYARMQGKAALWLPGADHGGFETQIVFEKKLEKEGKSRFGMDRNELYRMMWDFSLENKSGMEDQLRKLGASCDWDREKFTLDEDIVKIVNETFVKLYNDGLVYQDLRPVNWCTKHQTSLSDLEVKYEEQTDPLYFVKYQISNIKYQKYKSKIKNSEYLTIATTRPETIFGDTAIAVSPNDKRFAELIGLSVKIPLTEIEIPVIADKMVDPKFGTGAVKITPAHDPNDFEAGKRHNLEIKEVIDQYGRLNEKAEPFAGLKIFEARRQVVEAMKEKGILEKVDENYIHTVGKCYKCGAVIEPRVSKQWYIAVNKKGKKSGKILAKDALEAVKTGKIKFVSEKFEKIFYHWLTNIRDWNISRQIVWGIRLPVWYRKSNIKDQISNVKNADQKSQNENTKNAISTREVGFDSSGVGDGEVSEVYVGINPPDGWIQETDVFDAWFSSGQWPFAALKAQNGLSSKVQKSKSPESSDDYQKFYPTAVMETGWDILFFWVARMIMLGLYETSQVPFKTVYLHGLVRDKDRQKMSKSKGNVIDPLGVAEQYGTDAVRLALVFGTSAGNDIVISEEKIRGMRNFTNKIWNASRFVLINISGGDIAAGEVGDIRIQNTEYSSEYLTEADQQVLKVHKVIKSKVIKYLENYQFSQAAELLYDFFWHDFCDSYIEASKQQLAPPRESTKKDTKVQNYKSEIATSQTTRHDGNNETMRQWDNEVSENTKKVLIKILSETLAMLHPFIPFVTEAVWQELREVYSELKKSIMISTWPK